MTRFVVAPVAIRDLAKVLGDLTEDAGEHVAAKYRQSFLRLFMLLEAQPGLGAPRPRLGQRYLAKASGSASFRPISCSIASRTTS
jgi:plasmid stabilization system protein ParE